MIVMKFGGSSVESAQAIQRVASIVRGHSDRHPVVVVSAMGKTTDGLLTLARLSAAGHWRAAGRELARLRQFHTTEAAHLARGAEAIRLDRDLCALFDELDRVLREITESASLTPRLSDAVASFGERLSSLIVTVGLHQAGIDAVHLDSRTVIVTDGRHTQAAPLFVETNALLRGKVSRHQVTVMGGFIGATKDGVTTTLGRGGSDFTAAIVGAALAVDEIQIWTDVDGMLTCDPRVVSAPHCLRSISFAEAEQMAKAGAKVLHPATVAPAVRQGITIVIRNSRNPAAPGTRIVRENACEGTVMSIACRSNVSLLRLAPRDIPLSAEFGQKVWDAFQKESTDVELIASSSDELTVAIDATALTPGLRGQLEAVAQVEVEEDRAIVTLVGHNAARNSSNAARAAQRLRRDQWQAILACTSDSRFAFVVAAEALNPAAEALHHEFFARPDPAVFIPNRASVTVAEAPVPRTRLVAAESGIF